MSCECEECGKVSIISNITLCEDCYGKEIEASKKQGVLEELWLIGKELTSFIGGDKSTNIERNRINNYIQKRIKELKGAKE